MFWDRVAGVYDIFVNVINGKTHRVLQRTEKNCSAFTHVTFRQADILSLDFPDSAFDKVVAGNVT